MLIFVIICVHAHVILPAKDFPGILGCKPFRAEMNRFIDQQNYLDMNYFDNRLII